MKKYVVSVFVNFCLVKRYVTESVEIAEIMVEHITDEVTDVSIREVYLNA